MEQFNIQLDKNWVSPSVLAKELDIDTSTVTAWIRRNQIDYIVFAGLVRRKHMVDRRTAPGKRPIGAPKKSK